MELSIYIEKCKIDKRIKRKLLYELSFRQKKLVFQYRMSGGVGFMVCPSCKNDIEIEYVNFCSVCGQRLSWYGYAKYRTEL